MPVHGSLQRRAYVSEPLRRGSGLEAGPRVSRDKRSPTKRPPVRRVCQFTLTDCSRDDYKAFEAALADVTGVQSVRRRVENR